tara:strand:- start:329 stop:580 length:252 start_codon:yes stop_codon:yes gene_type:complete
MLDQFLTTILQVVIVVDVIGAIAYFVLGGFKSKKNEKTVAMEAQTSSLWSRLTRRRQPQMVAAQPSDFDNLRRVLYSYEEGLV